MPAYNLHEIAGFLTNERFAIHGISSEAYAQNIKILGCLGNIAAQADDKDLSVQPFGSRVLGYAEPDVDWVTLAEGGVHNIFGEGVIPASDNLLLTRLAALTAINAGLPAHRRQRRYNLITIWHSDTYLGERKRIIKKLSERLTLETDQVKQVITEPLFEHRRTKFGMPRQFTTYRQELSDWAEQRNGDLKHLPAYSLYRGVSKL